jgi:hypothetical protein
MTERDFLSQLFLLRQDIEATPMLEPFSAQQRERWAARLGDLINRRNAAQESAAPAPPAIRALIEDLKQQRERAAEIGLSAAGKTKGVECAGVCEGLDYAISKIEQALAPHKENR